MSETILREGTNCWSRARAGRAAVIVDAADYFAALADAFERAEHSIVMLGWDFHSRVRLRRGEDGSEEDELLALLARQVDRRESLRVSILCWDFAMIYALEREWQPLYRFDWTTHRRISFRLDSAHPFGASQHQKVVVVDDAVAFSGGLDVTVCRWDTRDHVAEHPLRNDPGFDGYGPFHDVQMAVDGDAALALGELARERWKRATGKSIPPVRRDPDRDVWPTGIAPDFRDVDVGISRTLPAHEDRAEVREVEQLYIDSLRAARETIYIENQYFTSDRVGDLLEERLAEDDGPEVVVVLPSSLSGWLEEKTMGVLAARIMGRLREADRHGRLRILEPVIPGDGGVCVHSKVTVVDDRFVRIGSANTSNRSMGLDSECDLSIESTPDRDVSRDVRRVLDSLVGEHLGRGADEVADARRRAGSLRGAIDELSSGDRRLTPVSEPDPGWLEEVVAEHRPFDPEEPVRFEELWPQFKKGRDSGELEAGRVMPVVKAALVLLGMVALLVAWNFTSLGNALEPEKLAQQVSSLGSGLSGAVIATGLFALAATLLVPVTALIAASGMVFGFAKGAAIGLAGAVLGAGLGYATGRLLMRDTVRRLAGRRLDRVSKRLAERGVLSVATLRFVPVAPFGVVNVVAGATHIRARDFLGGTLIGMAPGSIALAFFGERALDAIQDPGWGSAAIAVGVLAVLFVVGRLAGRRLTEDEELEGVARSLAQDSRGKLQASGRAAGKTRD